MGLVVGLEVVFLKRWKRERNGAAKRTEQSGESMSGSEARRTAKEGWLETNFYQNCIAWPEFGVGVVLMRGLGLRWAGLAVR